jgi:hypothetical protein
MNLKRDTVIRVITGIAGSCILAALGLNKSVADSNSGCNQIGISNKCEYRNNQPPISSVKSTYFPEYTYGYWSVSMKGLVGETKRIFAFNSVDQFGSYWTPERRAAEIAERMNKYISGKDYELVLGKLNGYHVVCTGVNGECRHLIFTIKQKEKDVDINAKVPALREHLKLEASTTPLYESACPQQINLKLLAGTAEEQAKAVKSVCVSK